MLTALDVCERLLRRREYARLAPRDRRAGLQELTVVSELRNLGYERNEIFEK